MRIKWQIISMVLLLGLLLSPVQAQSGIIIDASNADILERVSIFEEQAAITTLTWSPDGEVLAYGTADGLIRLNLVFDEGVDIPPLAGHTDAISGLAFDPAGEVLVSASLDGTVRVWDAVTGEPRTSVAGLDAVYAVAYHPTDAGIIAFTGLNGEIIQSQWGGGTQAAPSRPAGHTTGPTYAVDFAADGDLLASGGEDNTLRIWDYTSGAEQFSDATSFEAAVVDVAFYNSPAVDYVVAAGVEGRVILYLYATTGAEPLTVVNLTDLATTAVAVGAAGDLLAVGTDVGNVWLSQVDVDVTANSYSVAAELVVPLAGHTDAITALAFNPDGTLLATASNDGSVRLWGVDPELLVDGAFDTQAVQRVVCTGTVASRVNLGGRAQVTFTDGTPLRLRTTPGGEILQRLAEGTPFVIIDGPRCDDDFTWWRVELANGSRGWLAEGNEDAYFIEPLPTVTAETLADATAGTSVIGGSVWDDACNNAATGSTPANCREVNGDLLADGVRVPGEGGIAGVVVTLGVGACPVDNVVLTTITAADGSYTFEGLAAGRYCVSVDPTTTVNNSQLTAGQWSFAETLRPDDAIGYATVGVDQDMIVDDTNFGWDRAE